VLNPNLQRLKRWNAGTLEPFNTGTMNRTEPPKAESSPKVNTETLFKTMEALRALRFTMADGQVNEVLNG
jgi:hypothetical protein